MVGCQALVRDGSPSSEYTRNTSLQAKTVTICRSITITICSLYLPPSENLNIVLLTRLIAQLPTPLVICGDFNGHSVTWGCDKNNGRGDRTDDFITDRNVCLPNYGSYTYLHRATETFSAIDLSLPPRTFFWRLNLWLNQIRMVVIIFLLLKKWRFAS